MQISVKPNIKRSMKHLTVKQKKQLPYATSRALNDTAYDGMLHGRKMAKRLLHKPIGYTTRGIRYSKSTKRNLTARVFINDWPDKGTAQSKYLHAQVAGGARSDKASERAFRRAGILPAGKYIAPTRRYMNAAGNVKPGVMNMVMSQLKAFSEQGYTANATNKTLAKKKTKFFLIPGTGIFTRTRRGPEAVLLFIDQPHYKARFPFPKIIDRRARRIFPGKFRRRLAEAERSAR